MYGINGDEIEYYYNDPEIIPVPSPEPHYNPHSHQHNEPPINNDPTNSTSPLIMHGMLGINVLLSISFITIFGVYIMKCINLHRDNRIISRNRRLRQPINVDNLNTLILHEELPDECCSICLEDFKSGDNIKKLNCTHIFHKECLQPWFNDNNNRNCPMCRTDII